MWKITPVLGELLNIFPRYEFEKLEDLYNANHYTKYFTGWQQFIVLLFSQINGKDSLREIETSTRVHHHKWYHIGFKGVKRSTLSDAMNNRPWQIYEGLFYRLLAKCQSVTPRHRFRFKNKLYSMDSTTIDLCLSVFPWAKFRKRKGAIKLHYLLDHSGMLPSFLVMTDGKHHDVRVAKSQEKLDFALLPDSILVLDKAYIDYKWLYSLDQRDVYFVTRAKDNMAYAVTGQHKPLKNKHILRDDIIQLTGPYTKKKYPEEMRLVGYISPDTGEYYEYITNNLKLAAITIAGIYKDRWQIEIFFKWIKGHLKIKSFLGTSYNAVLSQIWVAMCYYLLLSYIKFQTKLSKTISELSIMIREVMMERVNLIDILSLSPLTIRKAREPNRQMALF